MESISANSLYQLALQRDRGWFKEYHEFATFASFTTTSIQGIRNGLAVVGIGVVELPVCKDQDMSHSDPRANGILPLMNVLHAPDAPFNIIGSFPTCFEHHYPLKTHRGVAGQLIARDGGYRIAYFSKHPLHDLCILTLSKPPSRPFTRRSTLNAQSRDILPVIWPKFEQERWAKICSPLMIREDGNKTEEHNGHDGDEDDDGYDYDGDNDDDDDENDDHEDDDYEDDDENDGDSIAEQKEIKRKIIEQLQLGVGMHRAKVNIERLNALYGPLFSGDRNDVGSDKEKVQQTKDQLRTPNQIDGFFLAAENDIAESTRQNEDGNFSCFL